MVKPRAYVDPVIEEVREIRRRISERFDHDPEKLLHYYMKLQENYRDRVWTPRGLQTQKQ